MRVRLLVAMFVFVAVQSMALAQSKLHLKTFTASPGGFAVNSTLVYGDKDAILIDAQFAQSDAHRLAAEIIETGKNLTTVYVTHAHPDHYFWVWRDQAGVSQRPDRGASYGGERDPGHG